MPHGDGTGPTGQGPMTGRHAGFCARNWISGNANRGFGQGYGRGFGWGHGQRAAGSQRWANYGPDRAASAPMSREHEVDLLKAHARDLHDSLQFINERLDELEKE